MLKPIKKPSPIDAAKAEVIAANQALELEREKEKAIAARVEANRKAEFSARERLSKAHARYTAPANLEDFDAAMEAMAAAERDIAVAEREARPLKHLHETAKNATRLALEFVREAQRLQWQADFDAKRLELRSQFPDTKDLREAFGYWMKAGHPSQTGNPWGAFLCEVAGPLTQTEINAIYDSVEG